MKRFLQSKMKPHHFHFAHGSLWGVLAVVVVLLSATGIREGYFRYWFGNDYNIVDTHEVIQSEEEASTLLDVMRKTNIKTSILVGTPKELIYYDGTKAFTGFERNNEAVLAAQKESPRRFKAFCTFDPSDPNHMTIVRDCVEKGAQGFKLYTGHSFFYDKPLADPGMYEFYQYAQDNSVPVIMHVNSAKYQYELESVLKLYPDLAVVCPHFCLTSSNLQRLSYLFDTYPNLYTDISFGDEVYLLEGIARISADADKYREFITKYADRFFYGTDIIVTDYEGKNVDWLSDLFGVYRNMLEADKFTVFLAQDPTLQYNGLHLSPESLKKIYEENWERL